LHYALLSTNLHLVLLLQINLTIRHTEQLTLDQLPLKSCVVGDELYWIILNEQDQIDVWKFDTRNVKTVVYKNLLVSMRDTEKWTRLRKVMEKSEAYDQYLRDREEGFKNNRHARKKKRTFEGSVPTGTD